MLPTKFRFIWPNDFKGEESKKSANQNQESPLILVSYCSISKTTFPLKPLGQMI
jgi:hypothetical protein